MSESARPVVVDIFCGCGGLSEGFRQAGFDILLGIDSDEWAIKTFNRHHQNRGRIRNVEDVDSGYIFAETGTKELDVLAGGPPCQAFSTVAVAKWRSLGIPSTVNHPMNRLYSEFLRLVLEVRPKFFVMENVERMLSIQDGKIKASIESELNNQYTISFYRKNVADFGIPQFRKRALVMGNRLGLENPDIIETHSDDDPAKNRRLTVHDAIADLPRLQVGAGKNFMKYRNRKQLSTYAIERRQDSDGIYNHAARRHSKRDLRIFSMLRPGQWIKDLPQRFNPYRKDIFLDKYKKQPWNRPSSTILAHLSKDGLMFVHPDKKQNRTLTAREAARLQSFDDRFVFEGPRTKQYVHIGNAVPPLFAKVVAVAVKESLAAQPPIAIQHKMQSHKSF